MSIQQLRPYFRQLIEHTSEAGSFIRAPEILAICAPGRGE